MNRATKVTASTLGVLVGLAGIDHGIFEILQGNIATSEIMIAAIGPAQRFWLYGEETALTIVPNFFFTGILAVIFGVLVTLWSWLFIDRKYGAGILMLLSIILFLVGGGFAPIFMAILASLTASQIDKPLKFWRAALPGAISRFLGKMWRVILILFVVCFVVSVEIAIFGWPLTSFLGADRTLEILNLLSYLMLGLMLMSMLSAYAHDIHMKQEEA